MISKDNLRIIHTILHSRKAEAYKIKSNNQGARYRGAIGDITVDEWFKLISSYHYTCLRCRQQEPNIILTIDHIVPVSKGGQNTIDNIQPLCSSCNCIKNTKTTDYRRR